MNWFALCQRIEGRRTRTLQMIESMKESETDRVNIPPDLQASIEAERHGTGPLSVSEAVELSELSWTMRTRGKLELLNTARRAWLIERYSKHGRLYAS